MTGTDSSRSTCPIGEEALIRPLDPGDSLDELTDLLHRAYAPLREMGLRYVAATQAVEVTRTRVAKGESFVGVAGGRLVGTVTFLPPGRNGGSPWLDRADVCSFGQFAVDPAWQRRGLGTRLIAVCERRAAELGAAELALDTSEQAADLIAYYSRRGFRFVEHVRWSCVNYRSVIMSKPAGDGRSDCGT